MGSGGQEGRNSCKYFLGRPLAEADSHWLSWGWQPGSFFPALPFDQCNAKNSMKPDSSSLFKGWWLRSYGKIEADAEVQGNRDINHGPGQERGVNLVPVLQLRI